MRCRLVVVFETVPLLIMASAVGGYYYYSVLFVFTAGLAIALVGAVLNGIVVQANGWKMPVMRNPINIPVLLSYALYPAVFWISGNADNAAVHTDNVESAPYEGLADRFRLWGLRVSIGDLFVGIGVTTCALGMFATVILIR